MKRILASIGLVAIGATSLQADGLSAGDNNKLVTVSGALRGFYDDNFLTRPNASKVDAYGTEVTPSIDFNKKTDNTSFKANVTYDLKYYSSSPDVNDQSVLADFSIEHKFSDTQRVSIGDSFALSESPEVLQPTVMSTPLRTKGNNIRNNGYVDYLGNIAKDLAVSLRYDGTVYSYDDAAYKDKLDRLENLANASLRYNFTESFTGVLGYSFGDTSYDSDRYIDKSVGLKSSVRDSRSHFLLAGFDTQINSALSASVRVGAQFFDYYNHDETQTSPYADASLTYAYAKGANVQAGIKHLHNATDVTGSVAHPVLDSEATAVYLQISQPVEFISHDLVAGVYGSYQRSEFNANGGGLDGQGEDFWSTSANLSYKFNPWVSAEAGYNFDQLCTDLNRAYERNRYYLGIRATY